MLNNGYNNWLGTACLSGVPVCVCVCLCVCVLCVSLSMCMCACWFLNDCSHELSLHACRVVTHCMFQHASLHCYSPFACLCSPFNRFLVNDQQSVTDILSNCCDIPDEGGGEAKLHRQIWKSVSQFLWCSSNQASHPAMHAMAAVPPLIDDFFCRPSCLWSFNKVCFYSQKAGWAHCSDS